jgi:hypothetical protein
MSRRTAYSNYNNRSYNTTPATPVATRPESSNVRSLLARYRGGMSSQMIDFMKLPTKISAIADREEWDNLNINWNS